MAALISRGHWRWARHLNLLNDRLLDVAERRIDRLVITMPPRHGKSEFTSKYFPAWYLGSFPDRRIILAGYGAQFASEWGQKVRDILDEHGERLFDVMLKRDSKAADRWRIEGHEGGMYATGIGGSITGRGSDILLIDDPIKNWEEANSETYRQKTWDWFTSTAYTRLEPKGAVIVIQTRWHEDDLTGRILEQAKKTGERWVTLDLPAIAGDGDALGRRPGEPLWPWRYGTSDLQRIRLALGSFQFSALYQGRPVPPEGGLFKRSWFGYWRKEGDSYRLSRSGESRRVTAAHCRRFGTMDLAFSLKKEADYTVLCAWGVTPECDLILLDIIRERMEGPALVPAAKSLTDRFNLDYIGIEKVAGQVLVIGEARRAGLTTRPLTPDTDKVTRSIPAQVRMEAGQIYLPEGHALLNEIEHELLTFPRGAHDDIVDNFSYAAAEVQKFGASVEPDHVTAAREVAQRLADEQGRQDAARRAVEDPWDPAIFG